MCRKQLSNLCWHLSLKVCCHCIASFSYKLNYIKQLVYVVKSQVIRTVPQYSQLYFHFPEKKMFYQILDTLQERVHFPCKNSCTLQDFVTCQELCIKCKVSYTITAVSCKKYIGHIQCTFNAQNVQALARYFPWVILVTRLQQIGKVSLQYTPKRIPKNRQHQGR